MAGYNGYSMSNRAVSAYENGEKPYSKWTKTAVVETVAEILDIDASDVILLKPFKSYLSLTSWHHTSKMYNKTDFYSVRFYMDEIKLTENGKQTMLNALNARLERQTSRLSELDNIFCAEDASITVSQSQCTRFDLNGFMFDLSKEIPCNFFQAYFKGDKTKQYTISFKEHMIADNEMNLTKTETAVEFKNRICGGRREEILKSINSILIKINKIQEA